MDGEDDRDIRGLRLRLPLLMFVKDIVVGDGALLYELDNYIGLCADICCELRWITLALSFVGRRGDVT